MAKKRKKYTAEGNVAILRMHLLEKVAVSDLCDEYQLNPNVFYHWQKQFFENGTAAFQRKRRGPSPEAKKLAALEEKLANKNEVIAELMEENVKAIAKRNILPHLPSFTRLTSSPLQRS